MLFRRLTAASSALLLLACTATGPGDPGNSSGTGDDGGSAENGSAPMPPSGRAESSGSPAAPGGSAHSPARPAAVSLAVSPTQVAPGGTVMLTLNNASDHKLGYNLCTSTIETGSGVPVTTDKICTMELRIVDPGKTAEFGYALPQTLGAGTYRFAAQVTHMPGDKSSLVRSNDFRVR